MKKVDTSNPNVRIPGETDSPQNKLRYELYSEAFRRMDTGLKDGNHFEVIAIADSIITDRVQALTQTILHEEPEQYVAMSVGGAIEVLFREVKERNITLNKELRTLMSTIHGKWAPKRNIASHGFVVVTGKNENKKIDDRIEDLKETAEEGAILSRSITNEIDKVISQMKKGS